MLLVVKKKENVGCHGRCCSGGKYAWMSYFTSFQAPSQCGGLENASLASPPLHIDRPVRWQCGKRRSPLPFSIRMDLFDIEIPHYCRQDFTELYSGEVFCDIVLSHYPVSQMQGDEVEHLRPGQEA